MVQHLTYILTYFVIRFFPSHALLVPISQAQNHIVIAKSCPGLFQRFSWTAVCPSLWAETPIGPACCGALASLPSIRCRSIVSPTRSLRSVSRRSISGATRRVWSAAGKRSSSFRMVEESRQRGTTLESSGKPTIFDEKHIRMNYDELWFVHVYSVKQSPFEKQSYKCCTSPDQWHPAVDAPKMAGPMVVYGGWTIYSIGHEAAKTGIS